MTTDVLFDFVNFVLFYQLIQAKVILKEGLSV